MRDPKQSDSPSGYCREVYPSRVLKVIETQEAGVRRLADERHERRLQALLPSVAEPVRDFGTWVTL